MCCSCASHLLCGIQTACRIHHCCKRLATPGPVHFPTGSLFLRQNTGNFKHQITNKENICNKTYTFYYLSNRHTLLNHHNASLYLLLHIMETRCKSHSHLSTRWDGEKKSCLGSTHNANQILMKSWKLLPLYCSFRAVCSLQTKGWLKFFQIKLHTWTYCTCCSFCGLLWSDIQTIETEFQITTTLLRWRGKFTDTESMLHPSIYVCKKSLWVSWE